MAEAAVLLQVVQLWSHIPQQKGFYRRFSRPGTSYLWHCTVRMCFSRNTSNLFWQRPALIPCGNKLSTISQRLELKSCAKHFRACSYARNLNDSNFEAWFLICVFLNHGPVLYDAIVPRTSFVRTTFNTFIEQDDLPALLFRVGRRPTGDPWAIQGPRSGAKAPQEVFWGHQGYSPCPTRW